MSSPHTTITVPSLGEVKVPTGIFINNEWTESSTKETFTSINPANGKPIVDISHASKDDVDRAVKAARKAFNTTWGNNIHARERARLLFRLADLMERDKDQLAALESLDNGKPIRAAQISDIPSSIAAIRYYAGLADKSHGQTIDHFGKDKFVYTINQPIGVCGQIIPWNYPILMWAWKIAPALAAGCTVIMKPSELTSITALVLSDLIVEAGIPPGVVNTLPGFGATTGNAIARHMDIDKVAFTGSVMTGRRISIAAAESNLKKVTLELGGKSPILVFDSVDLEDAVAWTALGIWFNSGQNCIAGSRVYVQEGVFDKFLQILKQKAEATVIGQPHEEKSIFGPLVSEAQRDKVLEYIDSGRQAGARVVAGGNKWKDSGNGYWIEPTILTDVAADMTVVKEEISGPVIVAASFKTEEDGIALANDTEYGLAAAVFTNDTKQATRVSRAIDAGTVWVNQYGAIDPGAPFGGFKQSGLGRELGTHGLEAYQQIKAVHHNLTQAISWPL